MVKKVSEKTDKEGWRLSSVDGNIGIFVRHSAVTTVTRQADSFDVKLPCGTKPADGDKLAAALADTYSEHSVVMTRFEPFLGKATLSKLDDDSLRCRGAVATALSVKPWDVQVARTSDGGFSLGLPKSYVSSKHYDKLVEVATDVVGTVGWRVKVNTQSLTAQFIPGDPPLFPKAIPYPIKNLGKGNVQLTPLGVTLPEEGEGVGPIEIIDWAASAFALMAGTPGSGKSQPLDTRIPVPVSERFPDGWAELGQLTVGDQVVSRDGSLVTVDYLSPVVEREVFEVTLSDGQKVLADGDHWWVASSRRMRLNRRESLSVNSAHAKRKKVDQRRAAQQSHLRELAAVASAHKVGASSRQIADVLGIKTGTARAYLSEHQVPYLTSPGSGRERIYPLDEAVHTWAKHLEAQWDSDISRRSPAEKVVTTHEMAASLRVDGDRPNWSIATCAPANFPEADLPVDPYLLGAWLGDGTARTGAVTVGAADRAEMTYLLTESRPVTRVEQASGRSTVTLHFGRLNPDRCVRNHDDAWVPVGESRYCRTCRRDGQHDAPVNEGLSMYLKALGVLRNKHIPAIYRRASAEQRLAVLQGLMDTDGHIDARGGCELTLCDKQLAEDALDLIRSLGIKASVHASQAGYTLTDPSSGESSRVSTSTRYRIHFTTTQPVFRLRRKAERVPTTVRPTQHEVYVVDIRSVGVKSVRCIRVDHPEHTYLTEGFVPTHNTVALNSLIAQQLAEGASCVVVDEQSKAVDFLWAKPFLREHGWGCDSEAHAVTALALVYEEGKRRAKVLAEKGIPNWLNMPEKERFQPIFVVVDELSALTVMDPVPKGVPKDHPVVVEINQMNFLRALISRFINKIVAEQRFVGIRMVLSTQVTNASTGLPPSLKNKIGHRILAGSNPSKPARNQAFNDESGVVEVPEHVKSSGAHARGVGVADLEGHASVVYKSFYADEKDYAARLRELGVPTNKKPAPTDAQVAEHAPDLAESEEAGVPDRAEAPRGDLPPSGKPLPADSPFGPGPKLTGADGKPLRGAAAAAKALKGPAAPSGPGPMCPACDKPIDPATGDCGCSW